MQITRNKQAILACGFGLLALLSACQKTELPPSSIGEPRLFIRGNYNNQNVDYTIGNSSISGVPEITEDSMGNVRTFSFSAIDNANPSALKITLSFVNYTVPFGLMNTDIDNTFLRGNKVIADYFPNPANPLGLNTFTITVIDSAAGYSSRKFIPDSSFCTIDSVSDLKWYDNITYKMVYLSFSCAMMNQNIADSTFVMFTGGKATIAFPKQ